MKPNGESKYKPEISYMEVGRQALTVGGEVGCITLLIVGAAVFGGLWLDRLLGIKKTPRFWRGVFL